MLWKVLYFRCANVFSAACFTLRGHDIGLLWFLFLVGRICPLMQERFLRPLLKRSDRPMPGPFPAPPPKPGKGALGTTLYGPALLTFWFQTDLGRENSASYLKIQAGKTDAFHFSQHSHALVKLYVQFLCSEWSKFDRWVHAEDLYSILRLIYFDSWSWESFLSTCDVFKCLFPLDAQNEIQLLTRVFCYSWLVFYWIFGWEIRRL